MTNKQLEVEIAGKAQDIDLLKAQKKALEEQLASLRAENDTLSNRVLNQHGKIEQLNRTIKDLQVLSPDTQFQKARSIMNGKGWWWFKWGKLKGVLK